MTQTSAFPVSWSGTDQPNGSGIATFDVFVSIDNGPWQPWLTRTPQTSATYPGVFGHTYAFYSVATDNVGLTELSAGVAEATTTLPPPPPSPPPPPVPQPVIPPSIRPVGVALIKQGKGKKAKAAAKVTFSNGTTRVIPSAYQQPSYAGIAAALADMNGDGVLDSVRFTANKGKTKASTTVPL
jgi:hypothetical protein